MDSLIPDPDFEPVTPLQFKETIYTRLNVSILTVLRCVVAQAEGIYPIIYNQSGSVYIYNIYHPHSCGSHLRERIISSAPPTN